MYHLVFTSSKTMALESLGIVGNIQDNYSKQLIRMRNKGWAVFNEEIWHVRRSNHPEVVVAGWCTRMNLAPFHKSKCWLSVLLCSRRTPDLRSQGTGEKHLRFCWFKLMCVNRAQLNTFADIHPSAHLLLKPARGAPCDSVSQRVWQ